MKFKKEENMKFDDFDTQLQVEDIDHFRDYEAFYEHDWA